jgi:hypothetical protein
MSSALLEALDNATEKDLSALDTAISQAQTRLDSLHNLRESLLRKLGKAPADILAFPVPFRVMPGKPTEGLLQKLEEEMREKAPRKEFWHNVPTPPVPVAESVPSPAGKVDETKHVSGFQAIPQLVAVPDAELVTVPDAEPAAQETKAPQIRPSAPAPELAESEAEDGPGDADRYAADLTRKRRKVAEYLKTVSRAPVTKLATVCGINTRGRNAINQVVRNCPFFHVDADDVVSVTAAGERHVFA